VKYAFVRANREQFRTTRMCQVLQVSRSGYYDWHLREESERSQRELRKMGREPFTSAYLLIPRSF